MIYKDYIQSDISGVYLFNIPVFEDNRGSIAKTFHKPSFDELGLDTNLGESLITKNTFAHTVRGFHFQKPPYAQSKTIFCVTGSIINIVLDIRTNSPTYGKTATFELSSSANNMLYIPKGIANAYMIMESNTIIAYNLTSQHSPEHESGVRWDSLGLDFGFDKPILSQKDAKLVSWDEFISPF